MFFLRLALIFIALFLVHCTPSDGGENLATHLQIGESLGTTGGCGKYSCPANSACCNFGYPWQGDPTQGGCYESCAVYSGSTCQNKFNDVSSCAASLCYGPGVTNQQACLNAAVSPPLGYKLTGQPPGGCGSGVNCPDGSFCCNGDQHWDGDRSQGTCYSCGTVQVGESCKTGASDTCKAASCWSKAGIAEQCSCWSEAFEGCAFGQMKSNDKCQPLINYSQIQWPQCSTQN